MLIYIYFKKNSCKKLQCQKSSEWEKRHCIHWFKMGATVAVEYFCNRRLFPSLTSAQLIFLSSKNLWLHVDLAFLAPQAGCYNLVSAFQSCLYPHKFYFVSFQLTALASQAGFWCVAFICRVEKRCRNGTSNAETSDAGAHVGGIASKSC